MTLYLVIVWGSVTVLLVCTPIPLSCHFGDSLKLAAGAFSLSLQLPPFPLPDHSPDLCLLTRALSVGLSVIGLVLTLSFRFFSRGVKGLRRGEPLAP